jgi:hypothetical protein
MGKQDTFIQTRETIDLFKDRFNKNVVTRSKDMWSTILKTIKNLELDEQGNILTTNANLKILRTLRGDIKKTILTPQYKKDLKRFLNGFNELKGINDTYYKAIASGTLNANKNVFNTIKSLSIDATTNSLTETGITNEIIQPVQRLLEKNITTGGNFTDLTESLRLDILGNSEKLGKLERYTKQITTDSLNQFNANYNQAVSKDLGLQFYFYNGAVKETSRKYCINRVAEGRYFHKNEVEETANEEWAGKIPGTDSSSIFINRGGYNCGHQWLAVDVDSVPSDVVQRNVLNGNYKPVKA